jgi:hypothetical protein
MIDYLPGERVTIILYVEKKGETTVLHLGESVTIILYLEKG